MMIVEVPNYRAPVTITWTPTRSACIVWCARCRAGSSIYTTAFRQNHNALVEAVAAHEGCMGSDPAGTLP